VQISGLGGGCRTPTAPVIINVGSQAGVKVGDRLDIRRKVREVKARAPAR